MRYWKIAVMRNAGRNVVSAHYGLTRFFYNAVGHLYDLLYHRLIRGYVDSAGILMNDLVQPGDRVLDVGCGTGLLTYLAFPHASHAVGVDLSIGMLQKAEKKRSNRSAGFVNGDALHLPFRPGFDCCVSAFMLVMLPKQRRWEVIREMVGLLNPGGRLAFLTSRPELGNQWFSKQEWLSGLESLGMTDIRIWEEGDVFMNIVARRPR